MAESFDALLTDAQGNGPFRFQFPTEAERDEWVDNPRNIANGSVEKQHVIDGEVSSPEIRAEQERAATQAKTDADYLAERDARTIPTGLAPVALNGDPR